MNLLPEKTVERLSKYRRVLLRELDNGKSHIYSHELAKLLHITPVQVRRDIMLIGHSGTLRKGYDIDNLVILIGEIIDCSQAQQKVAIIGIGNLGLALLNYFSGSRTKLIPAAVFDNDEEKIGKSYNGVVCYSIDHMAEIFKREGISIGILTVPPEFANEVADKLVEAGVKGIVNYTPASLNVDGPYLEEYDMITSLEKVAYFSKPKHIR